MRHSGRKTGRQRLRQVLTPLSISSYAHEAMLATGITLRCRIMSASADLSKEKPWNIGRDNPSVRVCHSRFRQSFTKRSLHRKRKIDSCDIFPRYWTLDCLLLGYLSTVPRLVLLPQYKRVWMKQKQKQKTVGEKPWNSCPSQHCTSNVSGDLWSHMPFTVKSPDGRLCVFMWQHCSRLPSVQSEPPAGSIEEARPARLLIAQRHEPLKGINQSWYFRAEFSYR